MTRIPLDKVRLARALVLTTWASFFAYLWWSGNVVRYLGPRTYWVVVFGTVTLTIAAFLSFSGLRRAQEKELTLGQFLGYMLIVAPVGIGIMAPKAELGALAVSRKLVGNETQAVMIPQADPDRPITFIDIEFGSRSPEYASAAGIEPGREVDLVGFVTHQGQGQGFKLSRFYISCCAADAIPYSTDIVTSDGTDFPDDTWLRVRGTIQQSQGGYVVEAREIEQVQEPDPPYL